MKSFFPWVMALSGFILGIGGSLTLQTYLSPHTHTHTPIVSLPTSLSLSLEKVLATAGTANFVGGTGTVTAAKFIDSANSAYVLTPSATGNSLLVAGKVGIGTTGPAQALDVVGTGKYSVGVIAPKIYPSADSTTAFQINKADGTTNVLNVDTTNARVGVGTASPGQTLSVAGTIESTTGGFKFPDGTTQSSATLTTASTCLASYYEIPAINTAYNILSLSLGSGTWLLLGTALGYNVDSSGSTITVTLTNGSTTVASGVESGTIYIQNSIPLNAIITQASTTTWYMTAAVNVLHARIYDHAYTGSPPKATCLNAIRIGN